MIEIKNGLKIYGKDNLEQIALNNINLSLSNNGLVVICGDSGSGKTTLLNCVGGVDNLTSGEVINCSKQDVSYIFQDYALINELSIKDNLQIAYDISDKSLQVEDALKMVNIFEDINKKINELSGGQKQRVGIARSLISGRRILLADEPTGNLDKNNAHIIAELLKSISADRLVIVVTHNLDLFYDYADRLIMIEDGYIIRDEIICKKEDIVFNKNENQSKFSFLSLYNLSKARITKAKGKFISGTIILMFSFIVLMLALNIGFQSKSNVIKNGSKELGISVINFYKMLYKEDYIKTGIDDYTEIDKLNIDYMKSHQTHFIYENSKREFVVRYTYELNSLEDNEINISYNFAMFIMRRLGLKNINDIIGYTINFYGIEFEIMNYDDKLTEWSDLKGGFYDDSEYDAQESYCYMNSKMFEKISRASINKMSFATKHVQFAYIEDYDKCDDLIITKGRPPKNNGEIVIDKFKYHYLCDIENPDELLNKEYTFEFEKGDNKFSKTLTIVGLGSSNCATSSTLDEMFKMSNNYFYIHQFDGVALMRERISNNAINKLEDLNILEYNYYTNNLNYSFDLLYISFFILLIIAIPIGIVSILFIIGFVKNNINGKKREIGIFKSLSFSNKEIAKTFVFDVLIMIFCSSIIAICLTPIFIVLINTILKNSISLINLIEYEPMLILLLLLIITSIAFLTLFSAIRKINKKTDVDLVYGR